MSRMDPRKLSTPQVCMKDAELLKRLREAAGQQEVKRREGVGQSGKQSFTKKGGVSGVKYCKEVKQRKIQLF